MIGVPRKGSGTDREDDLGLGTSALTGLEGANGRSLRKKNQIEILKASKLDIQMYAHLLAGEDCGVPSLPIHTSFILVKTLLISPALDITFSLAERLVIVDSGCGRETKAECINMLFIFDKVSV